MRSVDANERVRALLQYVKEQRLARLDNAPLPAKPIETGVASLNRWYETLAAREAADARDAEACDPGEAV